MSDEQKASKRLVNSGTSIVRAGQKVIITASDEYEAGLIEDSLRDPELVALILVTGALRKLPRERARTRAEKLVEALKASGEPLPEGVT